VVEAAVVGRDVVGVEEDSFLYWALGQTSTIPSQSITSVERTPLEAGHGGGHFDAASKETGKTGKDREQQEPQCSSSSEEECALLVDSHSHVRGVMSNDAPCRARQASRSSGGVGFWRLGGPLPS
jgi:hypothetical protein